MLHLRKSSYDHATASYNSKPLKKINKNVATTNEINLFKESNKQLFLRKSTDDHMQNILNACRILACFKEGYYCLYVCSANALPAYPKILYKNL